MIDGQWTAMDLFLIFFALAALWLVQLWLTWNQAKRFMDDVRRLRQKGTVAIGVGGRRYRGGRAYVALATKGAPTVVDALVLSGLTVRARSKELPDLIGADLQELAAGGAPAHLRQKIRDAAAQAAGTLLADAAKSAESTEGKEG